MATNPPPKRILVIDPDSSFTRSLEIALASWGFEVDVKDRGEGLALAASPPAAIIMNLTLAGKHGLDVIRELRKREETQAIPILVTSSTYKDTATKNLLLRRHGVAAFLEKPVKLNQLFKALIAVTGNPMPEKESASAVDEDRVPLVGGFGEDISFGQVLMAAFESRICGKLTVQRDQLTKTLTIADGVPVYVASIVRSENFGNFLIGRGIISHSAYTDTHILMAKERLRFGEALVHQGILTDGKMKQLLSDHLSAKIISIFLWAQGDYVFDPGEASAPTAPGQAYEILVKGLRRRAAMKDLMQAWLQDPSMTVRQTPQLERHIGYFIAASVHQEIFTELAKGATIVGKIYTRLRHLGQQLLVDLEILRELHMIGLASKPCRKLVMGGADPAEGSAVPAELRHLLNDLLSKVQMRGDPYRLLGIDKSAPPSTARLQYQAFLEKYRPDDLLARLPEGRLKETLSSLTEEIARASEILSDPEGKRRHDQGREVREIADIQESRSGATGVLHHDPVRLAVRAEIAFKKGEEEFLAGEVDRASLHFAEAADLNPQEPDYWAHLGFAFHCRSLDDKAGDYLAKAMKMDSLLPSTCFFQAHYLRRRGHKVQAAVILEKLYSLKDHKEIESRFGPYLRFAPKPKAKTGLTSRIFRSRD